MFAQALPLLLTGAAMACAMMLALWVIHLLIRNAAVVDVGWTAGPGLLALYYAYAGPGYSARKYVIAAMAAIWSFRLAGYPLFARVIGHPEEGRYVQLRQDWKSRLALRFFSFLSFRRCSISLSRFLFSWSV